MTLTAHLVLVALLPLLSGCLSMKATDSANNHRVETTLYDSVDNIEKAAVTKDDQLCVLFEKDLTNSTRGHFALMIPLGQIRTNAHNQPGFATQGILRTTNNYDLYPKLSQSTAEFLFAHAPPSAD